MKTDTVTAKARSRRTRCRKSLRLADRERVGFSDGELRQIVADIKTEARGEQCNGCGHAVFGFDTGACTLWGVNIYSRSAVACKRWCSRG